MSEPNNTEQRVSPMAGQSQRSSDLWSAASLQQAYQDDSYYSLPAVKHSHYRWPIIAYFFIGGLASAAQFIATVVDLFGRNEDRRLVRAGRGIALAGALVSPPLLISDLHTPQRWYNMLRIFRKNSAMSIGSWALSAFGFFSGLVEAGQVLEDIGGGWIGRMLARLASFPAAISGGIVSIYTGTLLAATATPLWYGAFPFLSSLFASSAASTAAAALSLYAVLAGLGESTRRRLEFFSLISGGIELLFAALIHRHWKHEQVDAPINQEPLKSAWRVGVLGLAIGAPLAIHAFQITRRRPSRKLSVLAALAMLLGGFILRAVFVFGGNRSGDRPVDYLRSSSLSTLNKRI